MYPIKNIKLENVTEDSGWQASKSGRCITDWTRVIKTDRPANEIAQELFDAKDFPGWTGISVCKSDAGVVKLVSTWDSSD